MPASFLQILAKEDIHVAVPEKGNMTKVVRQRAKLESQTIRTMFDRLLIFFCAGQSTEPKRARDHREGRGPMGNRPDESRWQGSFAGIGRHFSFCAEAESIS
jgi:hypothetical protein